MYLYDGTMSMFKMATIRHYFPIFPYGDVMTAPGKLMLSGYDAPSPSVGETSSFAGKISSPFDRLSSPDGRLFPYGGSVSPYLEVLSPPFGGSSPPGYAFPYP